MSRAARRLSAGVQNDRQDRQHPQGGIEFGRVPVSRTRPAVLIRKLAAAPESERAGIAGYLRRDGSPRAKTILAELERRWTAAREQET